MTPAPVALLETLGTADVAGADAAALKGWLRDLKRVTGWVDVFRAQVTARLDELARSGESFGSESSHTQCSGMSARDAAKERERAATLGRAPGFAEAMAQGAVTGAHVDQLAAVAGRLDDDVKASLFEHSHELLDYAAAHDPGRFGRHVRDLSNRLERHAGIERDRQQRTNTWLTVTANMATGMYDVRGALHPELGAQVKSALDAHVAALLQAGEAAGLAEFVDRTVNRNQLTAQALGELIADGHHRVRPTVADITVIVDAQTLASGELHDHSVCETSHGAPLPVPNIVRLLCHANIVPLIVDRDGNPLFAGRTIRTANRAQRRALQALYRTCACEGCDVPFAQCEMHHIWWWEHGGTTDLDNLVPLCARHHHLIHELDWKLHLARDRTLTITSADGELISVTTPDMPRPVRSQPPPGRPAGPARAGDPPLERLA